MNKNIAYIGLEMEGVIIDKNGCINRAPVIYGSKQIPTVNSDNQQSYDTYDCLAEARSTSLTGIEPDSTCMTLCYDVAERILKAMFYIETIFSTKGACIIWDERKIPEEVHDSIVKSVEFADKSVRNLATGKEEKKEDVAYSSDRYRGGGCHINLSFAAPVDHEWVAKEMYRHLPSASDKRSGLPYISLYRRPGLWRETRYDRGSGFITGMEYRSTCFNMTASGLIHLAHTLEATIRIAQLAHKKFG